MDLTIGANQYRIVATERNGRWMAMALSADNGSPASPELSSASEQQALDHVVRWLEWQHEHARALDALQQAQRAYHRVAAEAVYALSEEVATGPRHEALVGLDTARRALDDVRGRRPL